jgi:hypothetical protein
MSNRRIHLSFVVSGLILVTSLTAIGQQPDQASGQIPTAVLASKRVIEAKVVAVRRVNLLLRDPSSKGITDEDRKPYVEIELYVGYPDFNTNLMHLVQIGDREFVVHSWEPVDEHYNAVVRMPASQFEELAENAEIVYRVGVSVSREELEKMNVDRKIARLPGLKVGTLEKKSIDREPTVEKRAGWQPPQ